jgi:hypothetical protein
MHMVKENCNSHSWNTPSYLLCRHTTKGHRTTEFYPVTKTTFHAWNRDNVARKPKSIAYAESVLKAAMESEFVRLLLARKSQITVVRISIQRYKIRQA